MGVKFVIVGAGRLGRIHGLNLKKLPNVEIIGVVNPTPTKGETLSKELGTNYFQNLKQAISTVHPDAVVITSPMDKHFSYILEAAENGIHVFVEKPMGIDSKENEEIVRAVERNRVKLQVGFQRLYDESFIKAKEALEGGEVGRPLLAELISRDPSPQYLPYIPYPAAIFDDFAIHDFATMLWMFGFRRMRLYASGSAFVFKEYKEAGDFDTSLVNVKYEDGPLVNIDVSRCSRYGYDIRAEILGENGMIRVENRTEYETLVFRGNQISHAPYEWFEVRFRDAYRREVEAFVNSVIRDERTFPDHVFAYNVGRVADAAKRSASIGEPVTVE
ncbi:putative dehydrogenase [Metallosphaera yellowstonensis MK1]|jgi:myo-inositol 2-dehydrogenase/D-chiro-inositol 1-dehydrogenase|uniref:Putative dehydrogenase n=1 Tax=Metallosphaera yellowstonensis MK1 TaxID=671065 RepID=H2C1V0_9CREN|nr:Gfo/Idh/MocA family oxidoreductase [Metallosphaera yellowstonensis]EHP70221.1 putative dehydrogenase [Metallosphaera yellowstonensis MK1]